MPWTWSWSVRNGNKGSLYEKLTTQSVFVSQLSYLTFVEPATLIILQAREFLLLGLERLLILNL